ncbi:MAG TPA: nuclear transport factor 2 family protein [Actinomycetota bacterium]|nr:nuclear transport factor 2 family protein [Actinomycetota bacterium]
MGSADAVVRRFFDAGARGDVEGMVACWTDDVVLHYAARSQLTLVAGAMPGADT